MRAVDGEKKPCTSCGVFTAFTIEVFGPRGASKGWKRMCCSCGEKRADKKAAA